MREFAGTMRERVDHWVRTRTRDALGGEGGDWTLLGTIWASLQPIGRGAEIAADPRRAPTRWRVTLRPCEVQVGDRLLRMRDTLEVREVVTDPAARDRVVVIAETLP